MFKRKNLIKGLWIGLTALLLFSCGPSVPLVSPTATTPPATTATSTMPPAPTTMAQRTVLPTTTPLAATVSPTMPVYYMPHPALRQIATPTDDAQPPYALHWQSDHVLSYILAIDYDRTTHCHTTRRATYTLPGITDIVTDTTCYTPTQESTAKPTPTPDDVAVRRLSPNKIQRFELVQVSDLDPTLPRLGNHAPEPESLIFEGRLGSAEEDVLSPVFYTVEDFSYFWTQDSQYLIAVGDVCYGGGNPPQSFAATGLYSLDADTLTLHPIAPDYVAGCEGSIGYQLSPISRHILYEPGIVATIDGQQQMRICSNGAYARSYTWSADGRYAYVACGAREQSDILHRYNTETGQNQCLTDRAALGFRAIEMALSPDQAWLAFVWGSNTFAPDEQPHGIWLMELAKLGY